MKSRVRILLALVVLFFVAAASGQTPTRVVNGKTYVVHTVVSGETLYKISKKYGCTVQQLQELNKLGTTLKIGQELLIPNAGSSTPPASTPSYTQHTVIKGETLSKIAVKYGTTVDEIKKLNQLTSDGVKIGQVLKVPGKEVKEVKVIKVEETQEVEKPVTPENKQSEPPANKPVPAKPADNQPAGPRQTPGETNRPAAKPVTPESEVPKTTEVVLAETATEKEENTMAMLYDKKIDQTRTFVVHPTLPKGSIIVVINESTGKMAYCRVVDNVKISELNGAGLGITKAVAEKIGLKDVQGSVRIKYAAP